MKKLIAQVLGVLCVSVSANARTPSMECATVAKNAARAVFEVSAKETPKALRFLSSTVKAEELIEEPAGRYSILQYRVNMYYRDRNGERAHFYYRVETRDRGGKNEKCFVEAVAYNHDD